MELATDWIVGFVDGEGCFHVSLSRHLEMTVGYQVIPEFVVVQHERDVQVLHRLKEFFDCGNVRRNHGDRYCLRVRRLSDLMRVCEFFRAHPLQTRKQQDFVKFNKIVDLMSEQRHLTSEGLIEIVDIALSMNTTRRPVLERIRCGLTG